MILKKDFPKTPSYKQSESRNDQKSLADEKSVQDSGKLPENIDFVLRSMCSRVAFSEGRKKSTKVIPTRRVKTREHGL